MPRAVCRTAAICLLAGLLWTLGASPLRAQVAGESDDAVYIDAPVFPGVEIRRALRFQLQSGFAPSAQLDRGRVDLYEPDLHLRLTVPLGDRAVLRLNTRGGISEYDFHGDTPFAGLGDPLDLYRVRLRLEAAYQLNETGHGWLLEDESWSLLGGLFGQSRWEDGRFAAALTGGGAVGVGYRVPDHLRISLGAVLRTELDESGLDVSPFFSFRWQITDRLTLRDRGVGLLLEYRATRRIELFASVFRTTERALLEERPVADDLIFSDRQLLAGAGLEWRIAKWLRFKLEAGGIAKRKIRVRSDDLGGTVYSSKAEPSPYLDLLLEVRPSGL